ncbi:hypothetical protein AX774_g6347, partial [Zancudomyces culisetae]
MRGLVGNLTRAFSGLTINRTSIGAQSSFHTCSKLRGLEEFFEGNQSLPKDKIHT